MNSFDCFPAEIITGMIVLTIATLFSEASIGAKLIVTQLLLGAAYVKIEQK